MKKLFIMALLCAVTITSKAQITTDPSGNVGIGTSTPGTKLDVNGPISNNRNWYYLAGAGDANHAIGNIPGADGEQFRFFNFFDLYQTTTYSSALFVNPSGFIGLGSYNPLSMLQVDDGCTKANIGDASGGGLNYGTSYLGFNAGRNSGNWLLHTDGTYNGGGVMYSSIYGDIYFAPIASTGNANQTISDASVKSKIAFRIEHDGTSYAKKIVVELTGWPDYVFKPTYKLKSLSEVKSYIDQNNHLPDMPSEKEVADKGLDLGEMNKILAKKVEELTLYLLELKSENDKLKANQVLINKKIKFIEKRK